MIEHRAGIRTTDGLLVWPNARPAPPAPAAADTLGCMASRLRQDQELVGAGIKFYRKRSDQALGQVVTPATDRGHLVGISRRAGHRRRIFHEHHAVSHEFEESSIYVRNFADSYRADLQGAFDFLLLEIAPACLDRTFDEEGGRRVDGLVRTTGRKDPALAHLVSALLPALDRPAEASRLFVDQLATAILTYLVVHYGGASVPIHRRNRSLSRTHEQRAKEMLRSRLDGSITIAEVAEACNLSRGYFTQAFRETTGKTPHQWLLAQRVERARELLQASPMPLAEVAGLCGFADQSHFTRVFAQATGVPPGHWRRHAAAGPADK